MDPGAENNRITFAEFELDTVHRKLYRDGSPVPLFAKAFDLLEFFIKNNGRAVSKNEIMDAVWPDQFVEEANLSVQVSAIRKALGESRGEPRFLVTLPGKGYRFVADTVELAGTIRESRVERRPPSAEVVGPPSMSPRKAVIAVAVAAGLLIAVAFIAYRFNPTPPDSGISSIAVLPFSTDAAVENLAYVGDGLAESVTYSLSRSSGLRVMSRHSAFRYKGREMDAATVGRELNVDAVLVGSVSQVGDVLKVSAELISARDHSVIWGDRFERKMTEISRVEDDIAGSIATRLRLKFAGDKGESGFQQPVDPDAYRLYLLGRFHLNQLTDDGFRKAAEYFQQAIDRQPTYAPAYAGLAESFHRLSGWNAVSPHEGFPKAREAALKALEIDPDLPAAHTALATVKHLYDWDALGAEAEFRRAIELDPNSADARQMFGYYLSAQARFDEALAEMRLATELDPLSIEKTAGVGEVLFLARRYDEAEAEYRKALEMDPNSGFVHWAIGRALLEKGESEGAIASFRKAITLSGDSPDELVELGRAYARSGRKLDATKTLEQLKAISGRRYVSPVSIASLYAALGNNDAAFEWIERAAREKDFLLSLLKVDPMFDPLRADPRFAGILERTGHTERLK